MRQAFREIYNRELGLLRDRGREFAETHPGIAANLGGLLDGNTDPALAGLLEGTAFLAARVQQNIEEQFRTFTREYLEQVFPDALAPTPSVMMVQASLPHSTLDLSAGVTFPRNSPLVARLVDNERRVACRFRLCRALRLLPIALSGATYMDRAAPLEAMGLRTDPKVTKGGLSFDLARLDNAGQPGEAPLSGLPLDTLDIQFVGSSLLAAALYEQVHCSRAKVWLRYADRHGDCVLRPLPSDCIEQIGFEEDEALLPHDGRLFQGFARLRDAFVFPGHLLGMRLRGLGVALQGIDSPSVKVVIELNRIDRALADQFDPGLLQLFCAPAINLFEETASTLPADPKRYRYLVEPDNRPVTHYEIYRITDVFARYTGSRDRVRVHPLYAQPLTAAAGPGQSLCYTTEREPRRLTGDERRFGVSRYSYRGSETFLTLYEPPDEENAARLQVRTLCTNRHLPEYLPIGQSREEFSMIENHAVKASCVAGPTPPRAPLIDTEGSGVRPAAGDAYWRLISYLSLSIQGLTDQNPEKAAARLRELLSLFADISDPATRTRIEGLKAVRTRPITRTIYREGGYHQARGTEVTLDFDEDAFEGSGVMILAAVIDRFLPEYAAVNSFTQCVVDSRQRGQLHRFPPRSGAGPLL